jgi:predicted PurR-regulated permease PerM
MRTVPRSVLVLLFVALLLVGATTSIAIRAAAQANLLDSLSALSFPAMDLERIAAASPEMADRMQALAASNAETARKHEELQAQLAAGVLESTRWLVGLLLAMKLVLVATIFVGRRPRQAAA